MEWITDPQAWIALATLTVLEIVLGIDNIVFIAILAGKVPEDARGRSPARREEGDGHLRRRCRPDRPAGHRLGETLQDDVSDELDSEWSN